MQPLEEKYLPKKNSFLKNNMVFLSFFQYFFQILAQKNGHWACPVFLQKNFLTSTEICSQKHFSDSTYQIGQPSKISSHLSIWYKSTTSVII